MVVLFLFQHRLRPLISAIAHLHYALRQSAAVLTTAVPIFPFFVVVFIQPLHINMELPSIFYQEVTKSISTKRIFIYVTMAPNQVAGGLSPMISALIPITINSIFLFVHWRMEGIPGQAAMVLLFVHDGVRAVGIFRSRHFQVVPVLAVFELIVNNVVFSHFATFTTISFQFSRALFIVKMSVLLLIPVFSLTTQLIYSSNVFQLDLVFVFLTVFSQILFQIFHISTH
jgi:hypothetical protein